MRRTSVMLEFSDEVYDSVVEPMKKSKSFSKLIATLVEGYLNDGYIRAYADDNIEDLRRSVVSSFNTSIDSMAESLSNMGLFTDELESVSMSGKAKFGAKADKYKKEYSDSGFADEKDVQSNKEEIGKLNKRLDDMQSSLDSMLKTLLETVKGSKDNAAQNVSTPIQGYGYPMFNPYMNMMGGVYSAIPNAMGGTVNTANIPNGYMGNVVNGFVGNNATMNSNMTGVMNRNMSGVSGSSVLGDVSQQTANTQVSNNTETPSTTNSSGIQNENTSSVGVKDTLDSGEGTKERVSSKIIENPVKVEEPIEVEKSTKINDIFEEGSSIISDDDMQVANDFMSSVLEGNAFAF